MKRDQIIVLPEVPLTTFTVSENGTIVIQQTEHYATYKIRVPAWAFDSFVATLRRLADNASLDFTNHNEQADE